MSVTSSAVRDQSYCVVAAAADSPRSWFSSGFSKRSHPGSKRTFVSGCRTSCLTNLTTYFPVENTIPYDKSECPQCTNKTEKGIGHDKCHHRLQKKLGRL